MRCVSIEDNVPEVAAASIVSHIFTVMIIVMWGVGDHGENSKRAPFHRIPWMILDTQQYFPEDPVEEGETVQSITQKYQRKGPGELH